MNTPIRYAVIGCGGHAMDNHIMPIIGQTDLLELTMLGEVNTDRCAELQTQFPQVRVINAPGNVCFDDEVDAVVICTPDDTHYDYLSLAIAGGKHVLVEKPAVDKARLLPALQAAFQTAQHTGLVVTSCHPWRWHVGLQQLRAALRGTSDGTDLAGLLKTFGAPIEFTFNFSYHQPTDGWKTERSLLVDHFNHEFDMVGYLFGHAPTTFYRLTDSFDRYQVIGVRDDGLHCSFHGTRRLHQREFRNYLSIRFDRGSLEFNGNTGTVRVWEHETSAGPAWTRNLGGIHYTNQAAAIMANFAGAIAGTTANYLTAADIFANTAACLHLAESNGVWRYEPNEYTL